MGLFSSIKKGLKKIVSGVKKVFSKVLKPFSKILNNPLVKGFLLVSSVFTLGATLAGAGSSFFGASSTLGKVLEGASKFMTKYNPMNLVKAAVGVNAPGWGDEAASQAGTEAAFVENNMSAAGEAMSGEATATDFFTNNAGKADLGVSLDASGSVTNNAAAGAGAAYDYSNAGTDSSFVANNIDTASQGMINQSVADVNKANDTWWNRVQENPWDETGGKLLSYMEENPNTTKIIASGIEAMTAPEDPRVAYYEAQLREQEERDKFFTDYRPLGYIGG
jgi:hypothetical protein